jgi:SAM-dependent methyltransferase
MKESEIRPPDLFNRYLELARRDAEAFLDFQAEFVEVNCPACGGTQELPGVEKLGYRYVLCGDCGTLYLSPRPSEAQLEKYYRNAESVKFWSTHFYKETVEARREKMFRPRAELIGEILIQLGRQSQEVFVDVGAGYGIFLEEVARLKAFATVAGVEPNPEMADICRQRGFAIVEKTVEAVTPGEVQADFAASFEVLEHVFDPLKFIRSVSRLLKPKGVLLLTTLTVSGFDIQVLWEHSKSVYPPHHINLISIDGMERLIKRAGLGLLELSTPGQLDIDIVRNMLKERPDITVPRFVHQLLREGDQNLRKEFQQFLSRNRLSSHVRVLASAV